LVGVTKKREEKSEKSEKDVKKWLLKLAVVQKTPI
jgi:hypothetical protein